MTNVHARGKKKYGTFAVTHLDFELAISHLYVSWMARCMPRVFKAHVIPYPESPVPISAQSVGAGAGADIGTQVPVTGTFEKVPVPVPVTGTFN